MSYQRDNVAFLFSFLFCCCQMSCFSFSFVDLCYVSVSGRLFCGCVLIGESFFFFFFFV